MHNCIDILMLTEDLIKYRVLQLFKVSTLNKKFNKLKTFFKTILSPMKPILYSITFLSNYITQLDFITVDLCYTYELTT